MMKKLFLILMITAAAGASYAQKKPKLNQAESALQKGDLGEAKEIVDEAIVHEKTKDDGKSWYVRGLVYAALDTTSNPQFENLSSDPLAEAMKSFAKADEMNTGDKDYFITDPLGLPIPKTQQLQQLWAYYLNKGVESYQAEDAAAAADWFEKTTVVLPKDTTGYIYAASAAQSVEQFDRASQHYYTLVDELDYKNKDVFNALIYIESRVNEDNEKALEVIQKAREAFPEDPEFSRAEITMLINMDKAEEARTKLENELEREPENADLLFTLGVLNDELGDTEAAEEAYSKALEVDPNHYNTLFNLAAMKTNTALDLIKEKNNLGISSADNAKGKEMEKTILTSLEEAIPLWEKANEIKPNDRRTLETMQYIYVQLKENEKAAEVGKQLDAMPEE
jgi:tetratricopeptide (TPR) repeat protein